MPGLTRREQDRAYSEMLVLFCVALPDKVVKGVSVKSEDMKRFWERRSEEYKAVSVVGFVWPIRLCSRNVSTQVTYNLFVTRMRLMRVGGAEAVAAVAPAFRPAVFDSAMEELRRRVIALKERFVRIEEGDVQHEALDIVMESSRNLEAAVRAELCTRVRWGRWRVTASERVPTPRAGRRRALDETDANGDRRNETLCQGACARS